MGGLKGWWIGLAMCCSESEGRICLRSAGRVGFGGLYCGENVAGLVLKTTVCSPEQDFQMHLSLAMFYRGLVPFHWAATCSKRIGNDHDILGSLCLSSRTGRIPTFGNRTTGLGFSDMPHVDRPDKERTFFLPSSSCPSIGSML